MEYVLTTEHLCKNYGHFKALNQCSMHVPRGAIYGFVGKNGAGKTTLIRLICGLQRPTSGSYRLYGSENTDKKIVEAQRRIGAVVETPSIYVDMTAEENMKEQYYVLGLPSFEGIVKEITAEELENTCRKCVKLQVTDTAVLAHILDKRSLEYEILSDTQANVYGELVVSDIVLELAEQNCRMFSVQEYEESLESYYLNLVGGGKYE